MDQQEAVMYNTVKVTAGMLTAAWIFIYAFTWVEIFNKNWDHAIIDGIASVVFALAIYALYRYYVYLRPRYHLHVFKKIGNARMYGQRSSIYKCTNSGCVTKIWMSIKVQPDTRSKWGCEHSKGVANA